MRFTILLFITILLPRIALSQDKPEFTLKFNKAKELLYNFQPEEALTILLELEKKDPNNGNLLYLIGACYTDYNPESNLSVQYLESAEKYVSDNYDADSPDERNASIHLYYFLAVGYAQNHRCEDATRSNEKFRKLIGRIGGAYIRDAEFWVNGCYTLRAADSSSELPVVPPPAVIVDKEAHVDPYAIENAKFVTQSMEYTTPQPLWGVQVGSFSKYVPVGDFDDIKNVDAFIDNNGKVRYVVGSFALREQAETLLKVLQESGYKDAFIVDVNRERRYHDRIITVNNIPLKSTIRGRVHYRLQIGAFRDSIPREMAEKYVKIDGILQNKEGDLTLLSVGHFKTYEEATEYKTVLETIQINDAFVVAYNYNDKITVKQAKAYQEKNNNNQ